MAYDQNFIENLPVNLGETPILEAKGDDSIVGMLLKAKADSSGGTIRTQAFQLEIEHPDAITSFRIYCYTATLGTPSNLLIYQPGDSGTAPTFTVTPLVDTNVGLNIIPAGTGRLQENGVNVVLGATGSTDNALVRADGTGGKTIQGGTNMPTVDDSGNMTFNAAMVLGAASLVTISAGEIAVTKPYHKIATEAAAATDDLDTITGGIDGMVVVFRANNTARTTVFKHNTGNMHLDGSADFSLDNTSDTITLIYDGTLAKWLEISRSNNGT